MKHLKKFNESVDDNAFILTDEDIEDYCLEMTDVGFKIKISKYWIDKDGIRSKQPISKKSIPCYQIDLEKSEDDASSDKTRWNGSYYLEDYSILRMLVSIMKKFEPHGSVYYYPVSSRRYNIILQLSEIDTEIGFDWGVCSDEITNYISGLISSMSFKASDNTNKRRFTREDGWSSGNGSNFEIKTRIDVTEKRGAILKANGDCDNKELFTEFIDIVKKKLNKWEKYIDVYFNFDLLETSRFKKKTGVFSTKEILYKTYMLDITIKPKNKN